jgi:hypothetical protein
MQLWVSIQNNDFVIRGRNKSHGNERKKELDRKKNCCEALVLWIP